MKASMKKKRGVVGAAVLAGILSVGGYALTNTITFTKATTAGYGEQAVTALTVSSTSWTLGTVDKNSIQTATFTLASGLTAGTNGAEAWFRNNTDTTANWVDCGTFVDGVTTITCDLSTASPAITTQDIGEVPVGTNTTGSNSTAGTPANISLVVAEK